jgi:2'-5' RNA ligase
MRLFIAADLSDATRRGVEDAGSQIRSALPTGPTAPRLVWVNAAAAHVTLRFIGEVRDEALPTIEAAIGRDFESPPFEVCWQSLGTFPGGRRPRVVWIGAGEGSDALIRLAATIDDRLRGVVEPREGRMFAPHVTIARVKEAGRGVDWARIIAGVRLAPSVTRVDHVTLYQSRTGPKGSTYTVRLRIPLQ